jgi:hypothetical protein
MADGWTKNAQVCCPFCSAAYDTDDYVPFSPADIDLYSAEKERLHDLDIRLDDTVQALRAAKHCFMATGVLSASVMIAIDSAIEQATKPRR